MGGKLEHVEGDIAPTRLAAILQQNGAAIVDKALTQDQLQRLNGDLEDRVNKLGPGLRHPSHPDMIEFYGDSTVRFDGLPTHSKTFQEIMELPLMNGVADELLLANCEHYLLNTGQLIQIGPGETEQRLHRDEDAWSYYTPPRPLLQVEAMYALTDFTINNGATRVVPGSHLWPAEREPQDHEVVQAEMEAGSALYYLGTALHGGGANRTRDEIRRGMFFGFVVGWLRTEENMFLTVPMEKARNMSARVQELLGYKAHRGIGVVDVGDPMVLLRDQ